MATEEDGGGEQVRGRGAAGKMAVWRGRGEKNQCHAVIAYYSVILCIDIDNTYVYICRD